jgi:hypothetical protein
MNHIEPTVGLLAARALRQRFQPQEIKVVGISSILQEILTISQCTNY